MRIDLGLLQIVFITLKLAGIIDWSWLWIASPTWISLIVIALVIVAVQSKYN